MNKTKAIVILSACILFLSLAVWTGYTYMQEKQTVEVINPVITSYEACVQAGYPVLESFPEQCRTPEGLSFTRELSEEESELLTPPSPPPAPCEDLCGDGECQEIVCLAIGCPCAETVSSCPADCIEDDFIEFDE